MSVLKSRSDLVSSAGWLYADLLLALTIIGFGTIVARKDTDPPITTTTTTTTTMVPLSSTNLNCNEFAIILDSFSDESAVNQVVDSEVRAAINEFGLPIDKTQVGLVLVYGGYASTESVRQGKDHAKSFVPKLRQTNWLNRSELVVGGANEVDIGNERKSVSAKQILLKIYLVYQGDANKSGCS